MLVLLLVAVAGLRGQDRSFRLGFQTGPAISWLNNNENLITRTGGHLGLKLGTTAEIHFSDSYAMTFGLGLGFHQGGEFQYSIGGNFLPNSTLSDPTLNTGDKPLPDGVKIDYRLQYIELPVGLKLRSREMGYNRFFIEAPIITLAILTRGRGDISAEQFLFERENIRKDLRFANIFWGLGAGIERSISLNNSVTAGIYYQNGLIDVTKNKGHRAIDNPEVVPPFLLQDEKSRATLSNLILRLGIFF